jgi:putative SOS response-associated peptidase YedK
MAGVDPTTGEVTKAKQPYFIRLPDRRPIAFAGLLSRRNIEGDKSEFICTILTRDAVGPAAEIHTRMPIALPKNAEAAWLYPALTDAAAAIEFARGVKLVESPFVSATHAIVHSKVVIEPLDDSNSKALEIGY